MSVQCFGSKAPPASSAGRALKLRSKAIGLPYFLDSEPNSKRDWSNLFTGLLI